MRKIVAYEFGTQGMRLHVACPACFPRAVARGAVWRAAQDSPWLDAIDGNPVGVYLRGETPPRPQCDDCGRALE
jgi:hypothetical protein